jgi:hypothetical protein
MSELIAVGADAPDFDLQASDGRTYRLKDVLSGSWYCWRSTRATTPPGETANSPPCAMRSSGIARPVCSPSA